MKMKKVEVENNFSSKSEEELVALWSELATKKKSVDDQISAVKSELQARALTIFRDHNVKFTQFFGDGAVVSAANTFKLSILNDKSLQKVFGDTIDSQVTKESKVVYSYGKQLETAIKAMVSGNYDLKTSLKDFLHQQFGEQLKEKDLAQLEIKLTGEYAKDYKLLAAKLGQGKFEEELFFIHQIKNGELIKAFLPEDTEEKIELVKRFAVVEETLSTGISVK